MFSAVKFPTLFIPSGVSPLSPEQLGAPWQALGNSPAISGQEEGGNNKKFTIRAGLAFKYTPSQNLPPALKGRKTPPNGKNAGMRIASNFPLFGKDSLSLPSFTRPGLLEQQEDRALNR
eukprot:CAMPEP_0183295338 /NCGR_PEP_ID=MMETSP0160_2-20130417/3332_1 /TAXON_ID=2839 ORGANISM="Odontella Sinensis, Strain Grunow 1884" /NCGR_SAMPLE_ID=MMETSP0160_2 /ASSEMBLY_ACC=CAM_ASM_000250 /LENGTH=118 /DNA_ID=CAMNT_0025456807 /DNA_START=827 /DNA_END=1184 /DNA_ORIENTATION=-